MFPYGAKTVVVMASGTQTQTVETRYPITVLGIRMQQSGQASETVVNCGSTAIAYNWAKDYPQDLLQYVCNGTLSVSKTGNDTAFISITYVKRDVTASTTIVQPVISHGDTLINIWLFLIFVVSLYSFYWSSVHDRWRRKTSDK